MKARFAHAASQFISKKLDLTRQGLHEEGQTVPAEPDAHVPVDVPAGVLQDEDRLYDKKGRGRDAKKTYYYMLCFWC